jgi:hypothetical protein
MTCRRDQTKKPFEGRVLEKGPRRGKERYGGQGDHPMKNKYSNESEKLLMLARGPMRRVSASPKNRTEQCQ